jgi:hypothetical protein
MRSLLPLLLLLSAALVPPGRAEDTPLEVHLARVAVHEAGLDAPGDAIAIWSVLRWRSLHVRHLVERCAGDLVCVARAYAAQRDYRDAWIGQLGVPSTTGTGTTGTGTTGTGTTGTGTDGVTDKPASWPDHEVSWERYGRVRWERMIELARRWLAGEVEPVCDYGPLVHWGSRRLAPDVARAERATAAGRWRSAHCYDSPARRRPTRNAFYCSASRGVVRGGCRPTQCSASREAVRGGCRSVQGVRGS